MPSLVRFLPRFPSSLPSLKLSQVSPDLSRPQQHGASGEPTYFQQRRTLKEVIFTALLSTDAILMIGRPRDVGGFGVKALATNGSRFPA